VKRLPGQTIWSDASPGGGWHSPFRAKRERLSNHQMVRVIANEATFPPGDCSVAM